MIEEQVQFEKILEEEIVVKPDINSNRQKRCGYEFRKMSMLREKLVMIIMVSIIAFLSVRTISITTQIVQKNNENTILLEEMNKEKQLVKDLQDEVNKITTSNEVLKKASENGLKINEDNVKVVE